MLRWLNWSWLFLRWINICILLCKRIVINLLQIILHIFLLTDSLALCELITLSLNWLERLRLSKILMSNLFIYWNINRLGLCYIILRIIVGLSLIHLLKIWYFLLLFRLLRIRRMELRTTRHLLILYVLLLRMGLIFYLLNILFDRTCGSG